MRRLGPILIVVIGLAALVICFAPIPAIGSSDPAARQFETKLGLDLQGGLRIEYQVLPAEGKTPTKADLEVLRTIIINRVDKSGVSEPQVVTQGNDRIVVEMPGIQNADQIRKLVGTTGRLDFVPLGTTTATTGQALDLTAFPPLFSGDRGRGRQHRRGPDRPAHGRLHAQAHRQGPLRELHRGPHRPVLRHRPRRQGHHGAGDPELDPQRPGPDHLRRHRRLSAGRRPEPGHDPPVRPAPVSRSRSSPTRR